MRNMMMCEPKNNTSNAVRVLVLLCVAFGGLLMLAVLTQVLQLMGITSLNLLTVLQAVFVFILPALLVAVIYYGRPWRLLALDRAPTLSAIGIVLAVCAVSLPAMNWVVDWNQNVHLPQSMAPLEQAIRLMEEQAQAMTESMLAADTIGELMVALFVISVIAAVSEELFFRGAMMGIMRQGRANIHLVVWGVAIVFSAMHMQFLGFVPRMLLGVWLGYLLVWSRSLWVPIFAHALNNGMVVVANYLSRHGRIDADALDNLGLSAPGQFPTLAVTSAVLTVLLIAMAYRFYFKKLQ